MNYDLTTLTNYDGAFGQFRSESEMAFQADSDFEPSGSGETVPDVPAVFCDVQVYADLAGAQQALLALEENAAYREWLEAAEAGLAAAAETYLTGRTEAYQQIEQDTGGDLDDLYTDLYNEDENEIFGSTGGYAAYLEDAFAADEDFERETVYDGLVNVPATLPESLTELEDSDLEESLADAVAAADGANGLANLFSWLVSGADGPASRLPEACIDACCEWRAEIRSRVAEINEAIADIEELLGDQDTEVNRASFAETDPKDDFTLFGAPPAPEGGCEHDEQFYIDLWDDAVFENQFVSAF